MCLRRLGELASLQLITEAAVNGTVGQVFLTIQSFAVDDRSESSREDRPIDRPSFFRLPPSALISYTRNGTLLASHTLRNIATAKSCVIVSVALLLGQKTNSFRKAHFPTKSLLLDRVRNWKNFAGVAPLSIHFWCIMYCNDMNVCLYSSCY